MTTATTAKKFSGDGPNSKACYKFFNDKYGYDKTLLTPSCTASLEMAALLLDLGPGDEVIVPSFTFVTSANAFALRGVKIVFADSEYSSPNVSVDDILRKITNKTKAIVVVHYAGVPVDVHRIKKETNGIIPIVEDCAHAIGSIDPTTNDYIGKTGCLSTFSFHETKNVGIGEGGLLVVNDENLWIKSQIIREKGTNRCEFERGHVNFYSWVSLGSSFLMSDIDAAILYSALENIDKIQGRRLAIWDSYDKMLNKSNAYIKPDYGLRANAHMYFLEFHDTHLREKFCKEMKAEGIIVAKHYVPLHSSPYAVENFDSLKKPSICPNAEHWAKSVVRLPLFYDLNDTKLNKVVSTINAFGQKYNLIRSKL